LWYFARFFPGCEYTIQTVVRKLNLARKEIFLKGEKETNIRRLGYTLNPNFSTYTQEVLTVILTKKEQNMAKIIEIEGIGPVYAAKLQEIGIKTVEALLKAGAQPKGREDIAEKTGISKDLILEWVNHADLYRIKGVAEEYSDLLEEAGVDTVVELAQRNPENLYMKIIETNDKKKLVRRPPSQKMVEGWIMQAKNLPRGIFY